MARLATDPVAMGRLVRVLDKELGHQLALAVERGKIAANGDVPDAGIGMEFIEPGLTTPLSSAALHRSLREFGAEVRQTAAETLARAEVSPDAVGTVILVGGSSLMRLVTETSHDLCPGAAQQRAEAFTAVVDGLALAAAKLSAGRHPAM